MKECPVCGAIAFDDAAICYGCLYRFEEPAIEQQIGLLEDTSIKVVEDVLGNESSQMNEELATARPSIPAHAAMNQDPPEFCIHLLPRRNTFGGWQWDCSVEIAEKVRHEVVGRHAVQVH